MDDVSDYSTLKNQSSIDLIEDLFTDLTINVIEIEKIIESIDKEEHTLEPNYDILETLYKNEFFLYIDHIGIYDDLILLIDREPKTIDNEFRLAKIKKDSESMLRVSVVNI